MMDIFYIMITCVIFAFILHLETEVHSIKKMMEEHVKFDEPSSKMKNGNKK